MVSWFTLYKPFVSSALFPRETISKPKGAISFLYTGYSNINIGVLEKIASKN